VRAAIYHGALKPMTIESVDLDVPRAHEVVVRTVGSGVCHSDYHYLDGSHPMVTPAVLGHEASGIVEKIGSDVATVRPGDHIIVCWTGWCGRCEQCLLGHPAQCLARPLRSADDSPQLTWNGERIGGSMSQINGFAERMLLHERQTVKVPEEMPLDIAALIGCGVVTGIGAVINTAKVRPLSTVAVFGAGGVGGAVIQAADMSGARRVVAIDISDGKLEAAKRLGATHTVNALREDPVEAVIGICGDGGADYSFDVTPGAPQVSDQAMAVLKPRGLCTLIGMSSAPLNSMHARMNERRVQGCVMGSTRSFLDVPHIVEMYLSKKFKLDEMIGRRGDLGEINELFDEMGRGEEGRRVVVFDS
jgi:S-(hydroxymethyl)glutathione dehydrogenase / alcohol dehydrogenase